MPAHLLERRGAHQAAAAAFDTLTLSPKVWYDASDPASLLDASDVVITADAVAVKTMLDKSGNGKHQTQATAGVRPTAKNAIQNGRRVIRNGTFSPGPSLTFAAGGRTFFWVGQRNWDSEGSSRVAFAIGVQSAGSGQYTGYRFLPRQGGGYGDWAAGDTDVEGAGYEAGQGPRWAGVHGLAGSGFHLFVCRIGTTSDLRIDGALKTPRTARTGSGAAMTQPLSIHSDAGNDLYVGDTGELIILDRLCTDTEIADQSAALKTKWGIA